MCPRRSLPPVAPRPSSPASRTLRFELLGDSIYPQGEPVPLTLIVHGFGAARRTTASGQEIVSGIAPSGVLFGWSGLKSTPSSVELLALTDCDVAQWSGSEVRALAAADMALAFAAIDSMADSLHQTVERIEGFLHQDAELGDPLLPPTDLSSANRVAQPDTCPACRH